MSAKCQKRTCNYAIRDRRNVEPTIPQRSRGLRDSGLLLYRHCDVAVRREANLVAFHIRHETAVDVVMMAFVPTLATVSLGQFDAVLFDPIDGADMDAVRANYFHMLFDTAHDGHS